MAAREQIAQAEIDRANYDIVGVVQRYIALKKTGKNWSACCPFHKEKSASFTVNEEKGFHYCFGCGASGDAVGFVMMMENISFREAVAKITGNMPASITPEIAQRKADHSSASKPASHCEDAEKALAARSRFACCPTHAYLLGRNTAPCGDVATLKGMLAVELFNSAGELVNVAAYKPDGEIAYAAGGQSFGGVARLQPHAEFDGATILVCDYADAWRMWWARGGRSRVLAAISPENFVWMLRQDRQRFTHVAAYEDDRQDLEERGHQVVVIDEPYARKTA